MPCFTSLAGAEKNSSALQGRWLEEPEGFPTHVSFRKGNKTAIMAAARETKRHYGRREGNQTALWPPRGKQKGRYNPVGVRPPPPLRGSSPCKAGQFIPAGFDCRHPGTVETETCAIQLPQFIFPLVLNPPKCELFPDKPAIAPSREQNGLDDSSRIIARQIQTRF